MKKSFKEVRLSLGLTQEEFAQEFNYKSRDSIAKKEKGDTVLTVHDLRVLRDKFDIDLNTVEI